ncbi:undecaprenyl/decaprenyl-phosphate alpha-N-acetylglucosaminyl 1-phosphate transferase [Pedobacter sp. LMG 31464]|uniref:Undecaprenyl/decaprenyl-phosphate alpha-N-acetylglucosaminyl 1-phosphate transferase n=1 Tax=Pedobacter planticolens TaxID=2679964 RepID=A0A923ITT9_9SPHI|nr:MraY family glycosyltransferase [Pedobacter planticolens]MBB2144121.1 undecaprenyl/decaprenyl-phosphate alpha-N-acetylglucosaminyl 1-phosphate transferase [Pedobacter planticolens]
MTNQFIVDFLQGNLIYYISIVGLSFLLSIAGIPSIIFTAIKYRLFDNADGYRKAHRIHISRLGGVAIFCSFTITILLFATTVNYQQANFLITSCIILFGLGLKDDLYGVNPSTKFLLQLIVAIILVVLGGFKLTSLYGVFYTWEVNSVWGSLFSITVIIFVNNAFNLIDGIDGLAGTLGVIATLSFGIFFAIANALPYAFIAFAMFGAIAGFLTFNYSPAKIFMGDTGALIIGLVCVVLAIKFIELNKVGSLPKPYFYSAPSIAVAVLLVPVFDSLRIFFIRILHKKSPFKGDRNHVHHRLQRLGFNSNQIVMILGFFNVAMIFLAVVLQDVGNFTLITLLISICIVMNVVITFAIGKKINKNYKLIDVIFKDTFNPSTD